MVRVRVRARARARARVRVRVRLTRPADDEVGDEVGGLSPHVPQAERVALLLEPALVLLRLRLRG